MAGGASCSAKRRSPSRRAGLRWRSSADASWRSRGLRHERAHGLNREHGCGMNKVTVATWSDLADRTPAYALVGNVDLVVIRRGDDVSVLYGRCLHRGALLADG